jgi:hypothetical protein
MTNQLKNLEHRKFYEDILIDKMVDSSNKTEPEVQFIITDKGDVVCSQWNSEIERIFEAIGKELFPEMGRFCG